MTKNKKRGFLRKIGFIDNAQQLINEQVFSFKHGKKSGSIKNTQDTACRGEN